MQLGPNRQFIYCIRRELGLAARTRRCQFRRSCLGAGSHSGRECVIFSRLSASPSSTATATASASRDSGRASVTSAIATTSIGHNICGSCSSAQEAAPRIVPLAEAEKLVESEHLYSPVVWMPTVTEDLRCTSFHIAHNRTGSNAHLWQQH